MGAGASGAGKYRADVNSIVTEADSLGDENLVKDLADLTDRAKARLADAQKSMEEAVDPMSELLAELGGIEKVKGLKNMSLKLIATVDASIPTNPRFCEQHLIYEGAGTEKLIADGHTVKPIFDELCHKICEAWLTKFDLASHFIAAGVKSIRRSEVKVRVDYNGKTTKLKDVVRGTISVDGKVDCNTLAQVYDALQHFVEHAGEILPGVRVQVVGVKDRYQNPSGRYRDFLLTLKLRNYICELQVNFSKALKHKEAKEHVKYELERLARANLLDAAMKGDATSVKLMLATGVNIQGLHDSNGCSPLAYAALHGSLEMTEALLQNGADPLIIDAAGWLPVQYALSQNACDVAAALLENMGSLDLSDTPLSLGPALCATWSMVISSPSLKFLEKEAWAVFHAQKPVDSVKLTYAASLGDFQACQEICKRPTVHVNHGLLLDTNTGMIGRTLDWAVLAGAPAILVQLLVEKKAGLSVGGPHSNPQRAALNHAALDQEANLRVLLQLEDLKPCLTNYLTKNADWGSAAWLGTPLCKSEIVKIAANRRSKKVIRRLVQSGFTLSGDDEDLNGQLRAASTKGDAEFCNLLLDLCINIDAMDNLGRTALHLAVSARRLAICELLIDRRADVNKAAKPDFYTPSHVACHLGRGAILEVLHRAGADLKLKDEYSDDCRKTAQDNGKTQIVAVIDRLTCEK